ncbi:asparagine synthase (glutamine-hydrolyzing) [Aureimonas glaciei]|uniref:asparagine synthase (glutamine-hydrolyzing) n=1 Tax=Aureimonas glaciei TaxID=1776957 RepID=A0A916Y5T8_9HYPH|nr:asparagine synthase (glutamine-hydrolyzing) [Aureimonas glaciei]GGD31861.1 asparagine synthetase B [Aureimonas glaciei]
MCGIAGYWAAGGLPGADGAEAVLSRMALALGHRGPDGEGVWSDEGAGIGLAHRRLAVIDLSAAGAQPMQNASGVLVFNGEIYNHLQLRERLRGEGRAPAWRGHSDTETLLAAIEAWGMAEALARADGMFAFAHFDRATRRLTLARDRMGEKPLYYGRCGTTLLFASELKALRAFPGFRPAIDRRAAMAYLQLGYVPHPLSIYSNIGKLTPGTSVTFETADAQPVPVPYWSLEAVIAAGRSQPFPGDHAAATAALDGLLGDVVEEQMLSDVPLGAFLSGGIDSSVVTAMMQSRSANRVRTFAIGFEDKRFDESGHAAAVAARLGTRHTTLVVTERDVLDLVGTLPQIYDEPLAAASGLPTILLSRLAAGEVAVVLSGDGGDELFGGYNRHVFAPRIWRQLGWMPRPLRAAAMDMAGAGLGFLSGRHGGDRLLSALGLPASMAERLRPLAGVLGRAESFAGFYAGLVRIWPPEFALPLEGEEPAGVLAAGERFAELGTTGERMMALDAATYLTDEVMAKVDRAAMSASLETRAPLLDRRIVEFAWRLSSADRFGPGGGKRVLRSVLYGRVPAALVDRPKQGFTVPVGAWLRGPLRDWGESLLEEVFLDDYGLGSHKVAMRLWDAHQARQVDAGPALWSLLQLLAWLKVQGA